MSDILVALAALIFGGVIMNFCSAGLVAGLYFWRGSRKMSVRALTGAGLTGVLFFLMLSGAFLASSMENYPAVAIAVPMIIVVGAVTSLPGAFLMSRKIAKSDPFGDTFK